MKRRQAATGLATAWSLFYVVLGCWWWFGGDGYPFGRNDIRGPESGSLLADVERAEGAPWLVAIAAIATCTGLAMGRRSIARWARAIVGVVACGIVAVLIGVVMDARSITLLPPLGVVGWTMIEDWPTLNQLLVGVGALCWIAATATFIGDSRSAEPATVDRHDQTARRWVVAGTVGAVVAVVCPLPYAVIRWSWAMNRPIGAPASFVEMLERNQPGVAAMEAVLATLACAAAVLTAGLLMRWGRIWPRWLPRVGGRPVPEWLPLGLGTSATVAIFPFGRGAWNGLLGVDVAGTQDEFQQWGLDLGRPAFWGVGGLGWLFPIWALALGVALIGYHHRRRLDNDTPVPNPAPPRSPTWRPAAAAAVAAALAIALMPSHGATAGWITPFSPSLPTPTGPLAIGVRDVRLADDARGGRELMVSVFYPASTTPAEPPLEDLAVAPYTSEPVAVEWGRRVSERLGLRSDAVNWQFRIHARLWAPVRPGLRPVVVVSPPACHLRSSVTSLAEELASHGYVVISIDHTDEAPIVEFPGRRVVRADSSDCEHTPLTAHRLRARAADVVFVATHLARLGDDLDGVVDPERVGVFSYVALHRPELAPIMRSRALAAVRDEAWLLDDAALWMPQLSSRFELLVSATALRTSDTGSMQARRCVRVFFDLRLRAAPPDQATTECRP